jgi:hypothetical protein
VSELVPKVAVRVRARALLVIGLAGVYNSCALYGVTGGGLGHSDIGDQALRSVLLFIWLILLVIVPVVFVASAAAFVRSGLRHKASTPTPPQLHRAERTILIAYGIVPLAVLIGLALSIAGIPGPYPDVLPLVAFGPPLLGIVATIDATRVLRANSGPFSWRRLASSRVLRASVAVVALLAALWLENLLPLVLLGVAAVAGILGRRQPHQK